MEKGRLVSAGGSCANVFFHIINKVWRECPGRSAFLIISKKKRKAVAILLLVSGGDFPQSPDPEIIQGIFADDCVKRLCGICSASIR